MLSRNSPGLRLARYLSLILLVGPLVAMSIVWGVAALGGTTPQRVEILALGDKLLVGLLCLGALGLLSEFVLLPMILRDRK
jgi:hypothetical protein